MDTNRLVIYNYEEFAGAVIFSKQINISVGSEIEINFNDPKLGFKEGSWKRPIGTLLFRIHDLVDYDGNEAAVTQLAMEGI